MVRLLCKKLFPLSPHSCANFELNDFPFLSSSELIQRDMRLSAVQAPGEK